MKKILIAVFVIFISLFFVQNSHSYETKWKKVIWGYQDRLYQVDCCELNSLIEQFKNNKISYNDCVIAGIKFLKENESKFSSNINYDDIKRTSKIKYRSPMKFMAFLYANYIKLSPDALKELQTSLWDLTPYLNRKFSTQEIELLNSVEKTIKIADKNGITKKRDVIDAFKKLIDNGFMTKAEATVYMVLVMKIVSLHPEALQVKYNIDFSEFWQFDSHVTGWIRENEKEIEADKKSYRAIQILLSDFNFELFYYINFIKK